MKRTGERTGKLAESWLTHGNLSDDDVRATAIHTLKVLGLPLGIAEMHTFKSRQCKYVIPYVEQLGRPCKGCKLEREERLVSDVTRGLTK